MIGVVYKFTNKINGKVYVGETTNEYARKSCHKSNHMPNSRFGKALTKYGYENFDYEILFSGEFDTIEEAKTVLEDRERQAILDHMSWDPNYGYNKSMGVTNTGVHNSSWNKGKKLSEKHKNSIGESITKYKGILQYDLNGMLINEFNDVNDACQYTGIPRSTIMHQLRGTAKRPRCKYIWKIKE